MVFVAKITQWSADAGLVLWCRAFYPVEIPDSIERARKTDGYGQTACFSYFFFKNLPTICASRHVIVS